MTHDSRISFASDYLEGAHPRILERLAETNMVQTAGYGTDEFSEDARNRIREAIGVPDAEIHFLIGGTQTNATVIDAMLKPYEGVIAADTGHISLHEAGAIEFGGHKVLQIPGTNGKLAAADVQALLAGYQADENRDHMVKPGLLYISQPTEYGTLYSLAELTELSEIAHKGGIPLFVDGARLAYALAADENDVTLKDLARLTDVFYIGGTKCGALLGEAVVFPKKGTVPHFFTIVKQHGALLAKGRATALQFSTLFTDGLYEELGRNGIDAANRIRAALREKGYTLALDAPTNQIFLLLTDKEIERLEQHVILGFWEKQGDKTIMRIATSWATTKEHVDYLLSIL